MHGCLPRLFPAKNKTVVGMLEVTATVHLRSRNQLACGRNDGSIVLVPASLAVVLQLLDNGQEKGDGSEIFC